MQTNHLEKLGRITNCPVVAIIKDHKILIGLRNYTPDKWKDVSVWTLPGGRCDIGETIGETLFRETLEEVGISELVITDFLGKINGAKEGDVVYVFIGKTKQEPKLLEPEKFSEWKWQDINMIPENFINLEALKLIQKFISQG
jgi:ADP-ribose pyrophosphatase YjhB (NUDIX family)